MYLNDLIEHIKINQAEINGKWVPARPINYKYRSLRQKLRDAWLAFSGKADIVIWPENQ